jgi:hypothetical protein
MLTRSPSSLESRTVVRAIARCGVWQVFADASWFGDYINKQPAVDAGRTEAARIVAAGGEAVFVLEP